MEKPKQMNTNYKFNKFKKITPQQFKNNVKKFKQSYNIKRSQSQDNLRTTQQMSLDDIINTKLTNILNKVESNINKHISNIMAKESNKLNALIESKTKYYIDQKLTMLEGADYNLKRGIDELTIANDNAQAGNSFQFKYNGNVVAKITESGVLYCKNLWINGVNVLGIINDLISSDTTAASIYVKHKDLKHGTYEMDIKDIITKTIEADNATITNATITTATIDTLDATALTADTATITTGTIDTLTSTDITTDNITADTATITTGTITTGTINTLTSTDANITNLTATDATITTGTIYTLTSSTGSISTLNTDSITNSGTITSTGSITTSADINAVNLNATNSVNANVYYGTTSNVTNVNATTVDTTYLKTYKVSAKSPINGATNTYVVIDNSNLKVNGLRLKHIYDSLTSGNSLYDLIGANENQSGCAYTQFYYDSNTPANTYLHIGIQGYNGLKIFNTQLKSILPHYFDSTVDITGVAYFRNNVYVYGNIMSHLNPNMVNNNSIHYYLGKDTDTDCHALHVRYNYGTTDLNNYAGIGLNDTDGTDYELIRIYKDSVSIDELAAGNLYAVYCDITQDLNVTGAGWFGGNLDIDGHCGIDGNCMINGNLTVQGSTIYHDEIEVAGDADVHGDATVDGDVSCTNLTANSVTADTGVFNTSLTLNGNNVLTDANIWSSGNNWDVIPYTSASGYTQIGKYLNFYNTDTATSAVMQIYYDGTNCYINAPQYIYETASSTVSQLYTNKTNTYMYIGRTLYAQGQLRIRAYYSSTLANCFSELGLNGYSQFYLYYDHARFSKPLYMDSTISVTGASTLNGAVNMASTLSVSGATSLASTLEVTGQQLLHDVLKFMTNNTDSDWMRLVWTYVGADDNTNSLAFWITNKITPSLSISNGSVDINRTLHINAQEVFHKADAYITYYKFGMDDSTACNSGRLEYHGEYFGADADDKKNIQLHLKGYNGIWLTRNLIKFYQAIETNTGCGATINGLLHIYNNYADIIDASLAAGNDVVFALGKGSNIYEEAQLGYHLDSTLANSYSYLTLSGMSGLKVYGDKVESVTPLYCPSLYVNGSQIDTSHIAYTNAANNFTQAQTINNNNILTTADVRTSGNNWGVIPYTDASGYTRIGKYIYFYNDDTTTSVAMQLYWDGTYFNINKPIYMYETNSTTLLNLKSNLTNTYLEFGYNGSNRYARLCCYSPSTLASRYLSLGLQGYNALYLYYNKITLSYATACSSTLTANKLETSTSNAASAIGTNLKQAIQELITTDSTHYHQNAPLDITPTNDNYRRFQAVALEANAGMCMAYSEPLNTFVILGYSAGKCYVSQDGLYWDSVSIGQYTWSYVAWSDYAMCFCAVTASGKNCLTSTNGYSWTERTNALYVTGTHKCLRYLAGDINQFALCDSYNDYWYTSPDGITWTQRDFGYYGQRNAIAYDTAHGTLIAVGNNAKYWKCNASSWTSTWTEYTFSGVTYEMLDVQYANGIYMAVGAGASIFTSSDGGSTWAKYNAFAYNGFNSCAFGLNRWILSPNGSSDIDVRVSFDDGVTWNTYRVPDYYSNWKKVIYGNGVFIVTNNSNSLCAVYVTTNTFQSTKAILSATYPIGSIYYSMRDIPPSQVFGFGTWTSIFTGYERQCVGSQVLYNQVEGNGIKNKVLLLGAYNYDLIEGVFDNVTIPAGYHKEYRLTFQCTTSNANHVQVFLNNIATNGTGTWSASTFRILGASNYFKESDITLETTMGYQNPGINLKYSNTSNYDYRIYNITLHGFIVSDTQTYKWKRTA